MHTVVQHMHDICMILIRWNTLHGHLKLLVVIWSCSWWNGLDLVLQLGIGLGLGTANGSFFFSLLKSDEHLFLALLALSNIHWYRDFTCGNMMCDVMRPSLCTIFLVIMLREKCPILLDLPFPIPKLWLTQCLYPFIYCVIYTYSLMHSKFTEFILLSLLHRCKCWPAASSLSNGHPDDDLCCGSAHCRVHSALAV